MRRIVWFWKALPVGARMQQAVLVLVLGYNFVAIDLNPANRLFGSPLWMTTVPIVLAMIVLGRFLLPLMMSYPERSQQILHGLGLAIFGVWVFSRGQWWGGLVLTYLALIGGLWLEAACSFWFVSETFRRREIFLEHLSELVTAQGSLPTDDQPTDEDANEEYR